MIASIRRLAACAMLPFAVSAFADEHSKELQQFLDSLHYRTGTVEVKGGHATLKLTNDFRYLDAGDAQRVLELWGNPPDKSVLGLIEPANVSPVERNGWAVVITYSDDGHVADTDAAKIDYSKMLKDMQDQTRDSNEERKKSGYESVDLVGWATPPHYDAASNKLYWAKDLAFAGQSEHTLNYDIRVLGRGGYLSLNAVANMSQLPLIEDAERARDDRLRRRPALWRFQCIDRQARRVRHRRVGRGHDRGESGIVYQTFHHDPRREEVHHRGSARRRRGVQEILRPFEELTDSEKRACRRCRVRGGDREILAATARDFLGDVRQIHRLVAAM
jgi:hypothetical protein